mmetsp:Transcript_482/g.1071  ORF Transcript_482/g.1071 Transcript_482/m.1071 type:complete len:410 (+) Transcript_482:117-1346(+)
MFRITAFIVLLSPVGSSVLIPETDRALPRIEASQVTALASGLLRGRTDSSRAWAQANAGTYSAQANEKVVLEAGSGELDVEGRNLCQNNKLLPELYLLGGPKCATTSLAMDLAQHGHVRAAPRLWSKKEWHFWEKFSKQSKAEEVKQAFFNSLGPCPGARLVLGDFSINSLAAVQAPPEMDISACSCKGSPKKPAGDAPRLMKHVYGKDSSRITMVAMLREPLARMQSSWYHAQAEKFDEYWGFRDCCTNSFSDAISTIIAGASFNETGSSRFKGHLGGEGSVWASMYGRHLRAYMKEFNVSQFVVVPYKLYSHGGESKTAICNRLGERLHMHLNCSDEAYKVNVHSHPPLNKDLAPELIKGFRKLMFRENEKLVDVLARGHSQGMELAGYDGPKGNRTQIKRWLQANW